jgi:hypothetical protein
MRAAWIAAERLAEVREAARDWKDAGVIDAATLTAIEEEYPQTRLELARAWKVLIFVLISAAVIGVHFAVFGFDDKGGSGRFFATGLVLAAVTELLRGSRLAGTGSDAATSFWAVVLLVVAYGVFLDAKSSREAMTSTLAIAVLAWALACWRWGFSLYGAFAAIAGYLVLARFSFGSLLWGIGGAALSVLAARLSDHARLAPSRRRAFASVFVVSALALYASVNVYSVEERLVERIGGWWEGSRSMDGSRAAGFLFVAATAILSIAFVVWGILARRRLVLDTGALLAALSVLTLYHYVPFGAVSIIAFGLSLIGVAVWLNRLLTRAPGGERRGFTASPLLSSESEAAGPAAALVAATVAPSVDHSERTFSAGGGRSGGGGATGTF